ncbi:MAG: hypothetical protein GYA87_08350 [Christensenellaceae bacterium]|nr:hypothetical protein [Christensenellaceae bacterium]
MNVYIAYDTSCYATSVAAVNENSQILANSKMMLPVDIGKRGLRQSEAVFMHLRQINKVLSKVLINIDNIKNTIAGVGASETPRSVINSYMPVFEVGKEFAVNLSKTLDVPYVGTSHQNGHIEAAKYNSGLNNKKFLAFHISGGTTELLKIDDKQITIIAKTLDISAGQLIDRVGVAMGLPFPSGSHMENLAVKVRNPLISPCLKSSLAKNRLDCNFSGAETAALSLIGNMENEMLAYELFSLIVRTTGKMINTASASEGINDVLIFGGVASSNLYRKLIIDRLKKLNNNIKVYFGDNDLSGDNAVGVALITMKEITGGNNE